jgi:hypothetical protein
MNERKGCSKMPGGKAPDILSHESYFFGTSNGEG